MDDRVRAEARSALEDGGAGKALGPEHLEQGQVERPPLPLVALSEEDPHEDLLPVDPSHAQPLTESSSRPAAIPRKQRPRQMNVVAKMLIQA